MNWQYPLSTTSSGITINLGSTDSIWVAPQVVIAGSGGISFGIDSTGSNHTAIIEGSVAADFAVSLGDDGGDTGQVLEVSQSGRIFSGGWGAIINGAGSKITNEGVIRTSYIALYLDASAATGVSSISNSGTISGATYAVNLDLSTQEIDLNNSGLIKGGTAIKAGSGVLKVTNTGVITGDITFGPADDVYDGRGGIIDGTVYGGDGDDKIYGGKEANRLDGGIGNDYLNGGDGNDTLIGGAGADTLIGGSGSNTASYATSTAGVNVNMLSMANNTGDAAGDTFSGIQNILGTNYVDGISGDNNANIINTANGNDFIYGAGGADRLTGGSGADTFIYKARADSSVSTFDTITDFSEAQHDKINLSLIDANINTAANDAFVFIGTSAFTGSADQLRYVTSSSGTDIFADTNGDKVADFKIHLATAQTLQAGDFVL